MGLRSIIFAFVLLAAMWRAAAAQTSTEALVSPMPNGIAGQTAASPAGALPMAVTPITALTTATPVVVELFTSEGCASCPPADANIGKLTHQRAILALSYHVDYWDYIGWRDRNADPAFTERQHDYDAALGRSMVYTPQVVIAGRSDSLGTDPETLTVLLADHQQASQMTPIQIVRDSAGKILLDLPGANLPEAATIWLLTYSHVVETQVDGGENAGKRLTSYNVVRSLQKLGHWSGQPAMIPINLDPALAGKAAPDALAVIANLKEHGPVVAATAVSFKDLK